MPMHIKVSGVWKAVDEPHVKVSGVWKAVEAGYIKVSGTWKQFFLSLNLVGGSRGTSVDVDPTTVKVGLRFLRDGTVDILQGGVWQSQGNWIVGSGVHSTIGDDYEMEVGKDSGSDELVPAIADSAYRALSVTRSYDVSVAGEFHNTVFGYTVREIADVANNKTGNWTCDTEDGS